MLFVVNELKDSKLNLVLNSNDFLGLHIEKGDNTYDCDLFTSTDDNIKNILTKKYSSGVQVTHDIEFQYMGIPDTLIGYDKDEDSDDVRMVQVEPLTHKPSEEERNQILPRNMVVIVTNDDVDVFTHNNNIHDKFHTIVHTLSDVKVVVVVPKWNSWKKLKFPLEIKLSRYSKDGKRFTFAKYGLETKVRSRKDGTKFAANCLVKYVWDAKSKDYVLGNVK